MGPKGSRRPVRFLNHDEPMDFPTKPQTGFVLIIVNLFCPVASSVGLVATAPPAALSVATASRMALIVIANNW